MSTLQQLRDGLSEAWDNLWEGWQRLYRRAAGAITRFTPGRRAREDAETGREITLRSSGWGVLAAEVADDDDKVVVRLEVPGLDKQDFDIEVLSDHLLVRGEKRIERERSDAQYYVAECAYGSFERIIPLPDEVEAAEARAKYKNGVLRVELPKSATRRRKRISVEVR